jgi:hypothetical protein
MIYHILSKRQINYRNGQTLTPVYTSGEIRNCMQKNSSALKYYIHIVEIFNLRILLKGL